MHGWSAFIDMCALVVSFKFTTKLCCRTYPADVKTTVRVNIPLKMVFKSGSKESAASLSVDS